MIEKKTYYVIPLFYTFEEHKMRVNALSFHFFFFKILTELSLSQSLEMTMMSSLHGTRCAKMFPCSLSVISTSSDTDVDVSFSLSDAIKVSDILSDNVVSSDSTVCLCH